jgi:hypothetical protein
MSNLSRTAAWAHQEKRFGRLRRADNSGDGVRQWYDVESGRWRDYPIPDGARIEVFGREVVHVVPKDWPEAEDLFCPECDHTRACDATHGGTHGEEVDVMEHHCPGV